MNDRRLVGIDLGIASAHSVRVLDGEGDTIAKRKVLPTVESLTGLVNVALEGTPPSASADGGYASRPRSCCSPTCTRRLPCPEQSRRPTKLVGVSPLPEGASDDPAVPVRRGVALRLASV